MLGGISLRETFIFLQELLDCTTGIALSRIPYSLPALQEFFQNCTGHIFDGFFARSGDNFHPLLHLPVQEDTLYEHSVLGGITFLVYPANTHIYLLGPVLTKPVSREDAVFAMKKRKVPGEMQPHILQFIANVPVVANHVLYRTGDLVVGHLTGKDKPMKIMQVDISPFTSDHLPESSFPPEEEIVKMRQVEMRYEYSAALTDAIKQGNLSLALHMIGQYSPGSQTTVRNTNPLRNAQNYCIVLNTQLRHALEETGIHPYRVDQLSNEIGLEIEQLKNLSQLSAFFSQIIRRYCHLVQEHSYPNLKPLTNLAVTYIKEHLADNLTVKDTAKALTVNANYLSTLFRKEMGLTFTDFVNKERTKQAAALLKHTALQIQQIASAVGYNNTSYFAKQFLRFQGISPSHYRNGLKS